MVVKHIHREDTVPATAGVEQLLEQQHIPFKRTTLPLTPVASVANHHG